MVSAEPVVDTTSASVEVLDITILPGRRRLMGLVQVEVMLDGVVIGPNMGAPFLN